MYILYNIVIKLRKHKTWLNITNKIMLSNLKHNLWKSNLGIFYCWLTSHNGTKRPKGCQIKIKLFYIFEFCEHRFEVADSQSVNKILKNFMSHFKSVEVQIDFWTENLSFWPRKYKERNFLCSDFASLHTLSGVILEAKCLFQNITLSRIKQFLAPK